jgi:hypothetical protein
VRRVSRRNNTCSSGTERAHSGGGGGEGRHSRRLESGLRKEKKISQW